MKNVSRRRVLALAGVSSAVAAAQQPPAVPIEEARRRILQPVIDRRQQSLKILREFVVADTIEPTQGLGES